jgi:hypothetical protein
LELSETNLHEFLVK